MSVERGMIDLPHGLHGGGSSGQDREESLYINFTKTDAHQRPGSDCPMLMRRTLELEVILPSVKQLSNYPNDQPTIQLPLVQETRGFASHNLVHLSVAKQPTSAPMNSTQQPRIQTFGEGGGKLQ